MNKNLGEISTKSTEYIRDVENLKKDAKKRFESFYGRKKIMDYLIIADLTIVPIILVILTYFMFLEKQYNSFNLYIQKL